MTSITFLGTGGDMYVVSRGIRQSSCVVIQYEGLQFVIDPGPGSLYNAYKCDIPLRGTTAVICTTPSLLYANDLNAVIGAMTYEGVDVTGVVVGTSEVVQGPTVMTDSSAQESKQVEFPWLRSTYREFVERVIIANSEKRIGIQDADIDFYPTINNGDSVGMKIQLPDVTIGYVPDTGFSVAMAKSYEDCDILILSVPLPIGAKSKSLLSSDDAIKFIEKVKPKLAIITRFGKAMLESDPLQEARMIHAKTDVQVLAVTDGQVISPSSYSARGKQKRLNTY
ncbi:MAG: hypothetical protein ACMXYE_03975 [Candidatus Woesearchaeota archaeon]